MAKTAADVMDRDAHSVKPDDDARKAIELLADRDLGALPVVDGDELLGLVTVPPEIARWANVALERMMKQ